MIITIGTVYETVKYNKDSYILLHNKDTDFIFKYQGRYTHHQIIFDPKGEEPT